MMKKIVSGAALAAATALTCPAVAGTIFANAPGTAANCSFSTTCALALGAGDDFAVQQFVAPSTVGADAGSFDTLEVGKASSTAVNFAIYGDSGGAPGALLYSGTSPIAQQSFLFKNGRFSAFENDFNFASAAPLTGGGTYYLAVQAVSDTFGDFLLYSDGGGSFETHDGGATFTPGYQGGGAVAVALYDTPFSTSAVPEPATWAMMLVGMGVIGFAMRRRAVVAVSYA